MPNLVERVLVRFDQIFCGWESRSGGEPGEHSYTEYYWSGWGQKFAIIDPQGAVHCLGNSWWVEHERDKYGQLLSRKRIVKTLRPGDRIVFGVDRVYDAYDRQPSRFRTPITGGMEC